MEAHLKTPADLVARIVELELQLSETQKAIKPFAAFIGMFGGIPNDYMISGSWYAPELGPFNAVTAKDFRRLAACGNPE